MNARFRKSITPVCVSRRIPFAASGVVVALSLAAGISPSAACDQSSNGFSVSDWTGICAAYQADRHAAVAVEDGFRCNNPGQRWQVHFDGFGFVATPRSGRWQWGLELASYGRAGEQRAVIVPGCVDADGGTVRYQWDSTLVEWYINDSRGLEHGYTVFEPPAGRETPGAGEPLQFTLTVRGGLRPLVTSDGGSVVFVDAGGAQVVAYSGLAVYDADGLAVPASFRSGAVDGRGACDTLVLSVDDRRARYPLTIDPIAQQAYLKASNTGAHDEFGGSVAAFGDTIVVGAALEKSSATGVNGNQADNSMNGAGAAYVFVRDGDSWSQQAYLKASNTGAQDFFGYEVAISGDTIVVGAPKESSSASGVNGNQADNSAQAAGAAYIFVRTGDMWTQQAYLKASNPGVVDGFGISVAVSGDTVVVGAPGESSSATGVDGQQLDDSALRAGAAYVFVRRGTTWSQQAYLKASNTDAEDQFGRHVAVSGDTLVVGVPEEDGSASGVDGDGTSNGLTTAGAAYVFARTGDTWHHQAYVKASNPDAGDWFGWSVSISGDTMVVGAPNERSSATGVNGDQASNTAPAAGAAYVFGRQGAVWSQQAYLKASNTQGGDLFGYSAAVLGDTVVVSAQQESSSATGVNGNQADNASMSAGAAYIFVRSGGEWHQEAYLKASNTGALDVFGESVALTDDLVVVGAKWEGSSATGVNGDSSSNGAQTSGAAYVLSLPALPQCQGDLNNDRLVGGADLGMLLGAWGACGVCAADLDGSGIVDGTDLVLLLGTWGACQ